MDTIPPPPLPQTIREESEPDYSPYVQAMALPRPGSRNQTITPVPSDTIRPVTSREYEKEEDEEEAYNSPLVAAAAPFAGSEVGKGNGGNTTAYQSAPKRGKYAAVGNKDDDDQPFKSYTAYSRNGDAQLESNMMKRQPTDGSASSTLWSNPLSYVKSLRGNSSHGDNNHSYPPQGFTPPIDKGEGFEGMRKYGDEIEGERDFVTQPWWKRALYDT